MRDQKSPVSSISSQGRLQRPADFTGPRLTLFRQIFLRHGLPGLGIGLLLLATLPELQKVGWDAIANAVAEPLKYALATVMVLVALTIYSRLRYSPLTPAQLGWIFYLGLLSVWEEWLFRVAGPYLLWELSGSGWVAVLVSNALFGAMHYFTLRWRIEWCVMAFLGGLGFSFNFHQQGDLAVVAGIHWVATFLNTPRPPQGRVSDDM